MQILVTGGAGYIGSACVDALVKAGHKVVVFDDLSTGQPEKVPGEAILVAGSLNDKEAVNKVCATYPFELVIHLAAKKAVGESEQNPALYFETNVAGSLNLLIAMEKNKIPNLIFSSTAAVYAPSTSDAPISEEAPIGPVSVYGKTKFMVEEMIRDFARAGKIKRYSILRYFNVAGDAGLNFQEKNPQNVFPILAYKLRDDATFNIFGTDYETKDGTCVRDYIHLEDLVAAHLHCLEDNASGIYNLGAQTGYSVKELVEAFNQESGKELKVEEAERRPGDPAMVVADASLAKKALGWEPKRTLRDMVADTIRVYKI